MTVALPLFGSKISPRFDCAAEIMLVRIEDGRIAAKESVATEPRNCLSRINWLCQHDVEAVICGGISRFAMRMMADRGLRVLPGVAGDAEEILSLFLAGRLRSNQVVRRGRGGGRRRRHGRGRGSALKLDWSSE